MPASKIVLITPSDLAELPSPVVDNLPEGAEATVDISFEKTQYLKAAPHWAVGIAQEYQIPLLYFSVLSAATFVFFGPPKYLIGDGQRRIWPSPESMTSPPEWVNFPRKRN
ncbi:hypothetical protein L1049_013993 [Liquidambar formosana]|uniref:Uncharacterized protein n=1 Tax=Liquidambar formosana TaxID=63359 RepID=A0AAP0RMD1_LIQFO